MTDKKSNDSRRKLLKSAVVGSGAIIAGKALPENWAKPVVDSIVLPVHAETTPTPTGNYYADTRNGTVICAEVVEDMVKLIWVAGGGCMEPQGSAKFRWEGTVPLNGTGSVSVVAWGTGCTEICGGGVPENTSKSAKVVMNGDRLDVTIERFNGDFVYMLPLVDACPGFPTLPECTSCDDCDA